MAFACGVMPLRTGRKVVSIRCMQLVTICMVSLRIKSSLGMVALWHQIKITFTECGSAHSTAGTSEAVEEAILPIYLALERLNVWSVGQRAV